VIGQPEFDDFDQGFLDAATTKLSTLSVGEQFVYEFDFGDGWTHLCTVGPELIDPEDELGLVPRSPLASRMGQYSGPVRSPVDRR
jgi:pRiA4b ORF-3-like protein